MNKTLPFSKHISLYNKKQMEKGVKLSLKWGTLKEWNFDSSEKARTLFKEYDNINYSLGKEKLNDTPRQKRIICELIDLCEDDFIYLEFNEKNVSKKEAKKYIIEYKDKIR